ncbi:MAG TPA: extracellular solute-binding protein, partial [Bacillota bacterium]|nr:extracellular solute-binding protein [Bacillota bacterium]
MKKNKLFIWLIGMTAIVMLAACSDNEKASGEEENSVDENFNEEGMPIVDDTIDIEIFANKPAQNEDNDWNDILIWNHYQDLTNINVKWDTINPDTLDEKRNLALSGGDVPDAFFLAGLTNSDILKYGNQGTFLPLNDLIDDYAPNLTKLMENDPSIRKALTFPDGNIYSMPALIEEDFLSLRLSARPWINEDWLGELEMDMPETTDDFYEYLKAVKELDPLGDGKTVPYGGTDITELIQWLSGSFGVMNRGPSNTNFDLNPEDDSQVRFYPATDEYRELLEYIHKLFDEGLIEQNIFSIEWVQFLANASDNQYASMVFYDPIDLFGEEIGSQYNSLAALEGPGGHQDYNKVSSSVWETANLVITDENENPEATVRWMDYFYSDEGAKLYYMGIEDETYEVDDNGDIDYVDSILDPEGETTFEQAIAKQLTWLGSINGIIKADFFQGGETAPQSM